MFIFKSLPDLARCLKTAVLLTGFSFFMGCASLPSTDTGMVSYIPLKTICDRYDMDLDYDSVSQVITMNKSGVEVRALVGSERIIVNGRQVVLSAPVRRRDNLIVVPPDFYSKVIEDVVTAKPVSHDRYRKIIIDAGHGGKDPGALGLSGSMEKDVVLDIARRLARSLESKGFEVRMTRDRDVFLTLGKRTEIASRSDADLFISIHANASESRGVRGSEVYTLRKLSYSEKNESQRQRNHWLMYETLEMKKNDPAVKAIVEDMLFNYKVPESLALAKSIAGGISSTTPASDRGMKKAGFFVLRNTLIPAILIEVGFLTNSGEERLLKSSAYRQKIADSVAESILRYARQD